MGLQSSGEIKFTQLVVELDIAYDITEADMSLRGMSNLAGKTVPDALSEFYDYSSAELPTIPTITHTGTGIYNLTFRQDITSNGNSAITSYGYQWGTSTYSNTVTISNSNPGSSFSFDRTGLSPNTNYVVRGWVTNVVGTVYSGGVTRRTNPCPANGTYNSSYCSGCDLIYRYNNGSCGTYDVSQGRNDNACGCGNKIVSLYCSGDPFLCCSTPCGQRNNDDYSGLNSAITCDQAGGYNCTLGAYSSTTSANCILYWGRGTSWGDTYYGQTNTNSAGSGRCTGNTYYNYLS